MMMVTTLGSRMWWFCVLLFATASGRPDETQRFKYVNSDAAASALSSSTDEWTGTQLNSHYNLNSINGQECMQPGGTSKVVQGDVYYDCICVPNERGSLVLKCSPCDRCSRRNFPSHSPYFNPAPSPLVPVPSAPIPVPSPSIVVPSPPVPVPSDPIPVSSPPIPVPPPPVSVPSPPVPVPSPPVSVPSPPGNQYISGSYGHMMVPVSKSSIFTPVPIPSPLKPEPYLPEPVPSPFKPVPYRPIPVPSPFSPIPSPPVPTPPPFKPVPSSPVPIPSPFNPVPVPPPSAPVPVPPAPIPSPPVSVPVPFQFGNQYISGSDGHFMIPVSRSNVFAPVPVPSPYKPVPYPPVHIPSPPVPVPSPPISIPSPIGPINPVPFSPVPVPSQPVPVPPPPVPVPSPAGFISSLPGTWYISDYRVFPVTGKPGLTGNYGFVNSRTSDTSAEATSNAEPWSLVEDKTS